MVTTRIRITGGGGVNLYKNKNNTTMMWFVIVIAIVFIVGIRSEYDVLSFQQQNQHQDQHSKKSNNLLLFVHAFHTSSSSSSSFLSSQYHNYQQNNVHHQQQKSQYLFTNSIQSTNSRRLQLLLSTRHYKSKQRNRMGRSSRMSSSSSNDDDRTNNDNNNDNNNNNSNNSEAEKYKLQAESLREQIREMEKKLGPQREQRFTNNNEEYIGQQSTLSTNMNENSPPKSPLAGKRIVVAGANGRMGSFICRLLLRSYPEIKEVIALVHVVSENSVTSRGYGRLSYEVGAEDGIGTIAPAWDLDNRRATFQFDDTTMSGYNLQKLRIVECELLDPIQCQSVLMDGDGFGVDSIIYCATDFNGNVPRAVSGLNFAFLFRAMASPTKGRVEIEGLQNLMNAYKLMKLEKKRLQIQQQQPQQFGGSGSVGKEKEIENANRSLNDIVLVSMVPEAYTEYETPYGEFTALKRQGETLLFNDYPSFSSTVLQMGKYEDNFLEENMNIFYSNDNHNNNNAVVIENKNTMTTTSTGTNNNIIETTTDSPTTSSTSTSTTPTPTISTLTRTSKQIRLINRRDAAKAAVNALITPSFKGQIIQAYTALR